MILIAFDTDQRWLQTIELVIDDIGPVWQIETGRSAFSDPKSPFYEFSPRQHGVDDPAAADVRPVGAAVAQHARVLAAGVLQGVRENRHRAELAGVEHLTGEADGRLGSPAGIEFDGSIGIRKDATNMVTHFDVERMQLISVFGQHIFFRVILANAMGPIVRRTIFCDGYADLI